MGANEVAYYLGQAHREQRQKDTELIRALRNRLNMASRAWHETRELHTGPYEKCRICLPERALIERADAHLVEE